MGSGKFILQCLGPFHPRPSSGSGNGCNTQEKEKAVATFGIIRGGISEEEELSGQREWQVSESGKGLCSVRLEKRKEAGVV